MALEDSGETCFERLAADIRAYASVDPQQRAATVTNKSIKATIMTAHTLPRSFNGNNNKGRTSMYILSSYLRRSDKSMCSGTPDTMNPLK